jgi:ATP-dependent 26S proteasome regulatory subunit
MKSFNKILTTLFVLFFVAISAQQKNITLKERAAVIVYPSDEKLKQLKKESASEDEYGVIVEDALYYLTNAKIFLKSKKIKTIVVKGSDHVKYLENNVAKKIDIKNLSWDIVFYMPKKKPKQIDITDVEKEFQNYFLTIKTKKF